VGGLAGFLLEAPLPFVGGIDSQHRETPRFVFQDETSLPPRAARRSPRMRGYTSGVQEGLPPLCGPRAQGFGHCATPAAGCRTSTRTQAALAAQGMPADTVGTDRMVQYELISSSISIPDKGCFHISLTLLLCYRSCASIFSLGGNAPPVFSQHDQADLLALGGPRPLAPQITGLKPSLAALEALIVGAAGRNAGPFPTFPRGCPGDSGAGSSLLARSYEGNLY